MSPVLRPDVLVVSTLKVVRNSAAGVHTEAEERRTPAHGSASSLLTSAALPLGGDLLGAGRRPGGLPPGQCHEVVNGERGKGKVPVLHAVAFALTTWRRKRHGGVLVPSYVLEGLLVAGVAGLGAEEARERDRLRVKRRGCGGPQPAGTEAVHGMWDKSGKAKEGEGKQKKTQEGQNT